MSNVRSLNKLLKLKILKREMDRLKLNVVGKVSGRINKVSVKRIWKHCLFTVHENSYNSSSFTRINWMVSMGTAKHS